jgi:hypothetical protein
MYVSGGGMISIYGKMLTLGTPDEGHKNALFCNFSEFHLKWNKGEKSLWLGGITLGKKP